MAEPSKERRQSEEKVIDRGFEGGKIITHNITNLRGFKANTPVGSKMKQVTNNAAAARLRPAKTSILSHRLTRGQKSCQSRHTSLSDARHSVLAVMPCVTLGNGYAGLMHTLCVRAGTV